MENGTSPTDVVINHESALIVNMKFSEIKFISKSNTVNNMKLMILAKKIRAICMFLQPMRSECKNSGSGGFLDE